MAVLRKSKSASSSNARVDFTERCCFNLGVLNLQLLNLIDFSFGVVLIAFTIYLYEQLGYSDFSNVQVAWIGWCSGILGALFVLTSFSSFISIVTPGCRWIVYPSRFFAVILAVACIALGIASLIKKDAFFNNLNDQGETYGLSEHAKDLIKQWYSIVGYAIFGMAVLQIIRLRLTSNFRENALRIDGEFDALMAEDEKIYREKQAVSKSATEEKYNNLRAFYKEKYNSAPVNASSNSPFV